MNVKYFKNPFNTSLKTLVNYKLLFLFLAIAAILSLEACKQNKKVTENKDAFYTCSMHPQIMAPHPGKCPVCGMNLIAVQKSNVPESDEIQLSDQ